MSSILDGILDNVVSSNGIVSEQHDVNAINFVAGLSDPGEMIRCGYLPEIRRREGEQDAQYAARIRPIVMALPQDQRDLIMSAAIRRADLAVRNGRVSVAVAGEPAWHGLGVRVENAMSSKEAIQFANLNVKVEKSMLQFIGADGQLHPADVYGLRYADSNELLYSPVTDRYQPIQNQDAFDFCDTLAGEFDARYEAAGAIQAGQKVFLLMHFPRQSFTLSGDDRTEAYLLFTNTHGGEAAWCFPTNERVVCANTCRRACYGRRKGISIRHTGNVLSKISDAREACGIAVKGFQEYQEAAEVLSRTNLAQPNKYFGLVLDDFLQFTEAETALRTGNALEAVLSMTEAERKASEKSLETKLKRQDLLLEQVLENYEKESNGPAGTLWRGFNAFTDLTTHGKIDLKQSQNERRRREKRFESLVDGPADDLNQAAFTRVMALAV